MQISQFFSRVEQRFDVGKGSTVEQLVVLLPGAGCSWAKQSGGCYMCGFKRSTFRYSRGRLLPATVFRAMLGKALGESKADVLAIYNGGSFLNPQEIPASIPMWLSKRVGDHPSIQQLFIETRPEFVSPEVVRVMTARLGSKRLKVGIGLECVTDSIRETCIHKGFSLLEYQRAAAALKQQGCLVLAYVLLKPILLSECEAIEEAVKTIGYVFEQGADEVALEAAFVQPGTVMHAMFEKGMYRPPWLWSIFEVLRRTRHLGPVYVGGFTDEPMPIAVPMNCSRCSDRCNLALQTYRETMNVEALDAMSCECLEEWRRTLSRVPPPLQERLASFHRSLAPT